MPDKTPLPPDARTLGRGTFLELVSVGGWEYVHRIRGRTPVGIVAVTPENRLLLISQFRVPLQAEAIEIPAGLVGDHEGDEEESWQLAARRELLEETGWEAQSVDALTLGPTSAGLTSECILLVRARGLKKHGPAQGDGGEQITVHEVALDEADHWLADKAAAGLLIDSKVYAALYFVKRDGSVR